MKQGSSRQNAELARALLEALREVPGLVPAQPATVPARLPFDRGLLAVDVDRDQVTIRLVARELPLPPLLTQAGALLRAVLDDHGRAGLRLRLEITDLDRAAFSRTSRTRPVRPTSHRPRVTLDRRPGLTSRRSEHPDGYRGEQS